MNEKVRFRMTILQFGIGKGTPILGRTMRKESISPEALDDVISIEQELERLFGLRFHIDMEPVEMITDTIEIAYGNMLDTPISYSYEWNDDPEVRNDNRQKAIQKALDIAGFKPVE